MTDTTPLAISPKLMVVIPASQPITGAPMATPEVSRAWNMPVAVPYSSTDVWSANVRFGWLQSAGTGLFVVYNHTSAFDVLLQPGQDNQTLIIKYSYLINVFN